MTIFCWHKWPRWSEPKLEAFVSMGGVLHSQDIEGHHFVQTRICEKCGKYERRVEPIR